jgi:hypothetical protein
VGREDESGPVYRCPGGIYCNCHTAAQLLTLASEPLLGGPNYTLGTREEAVCKNWGRRGLGHDPGYGPANSQRIFFLSFCFRILYLKISSNVFVLGIKS